jgi:hypothetical protein
MDVDFIRHPSNTQQIIYFMRINGAGFPEISELSGYCEQKCLQAYEAEKAIQDRKNERLKIAEEKMLASFVPRQEESKHQERNKEIYNLRIGGLIYKEIASIYGLSVGQVRQVFLKEDRRRKHPLYRKEYV